jgi:lipoprotein NlpD
MAGMLGNAAKIPLFAALMGAISGCHMQGRPEMPYKTMGVWYSVQEGDTIVDIAARYKTKESLVAELNDLNGDAALREREEIFVPTKSGKPPGTGAKPTPTAKAAGAPTGKGTSGRSLRPPCGTDDRPCLLWPVPGDLALGFETRADKPHDGIDISAAKGTAIVAAADGEVLYSGNAIKGYGNLVIIRHERELITVYAHNDSNKVKEGERVTRGTPIAEVGQTGSAARPHLHFEVRVGESPRDPLLYLTPKK